MLFRSVIREETPEEVVLSIDAERTARVPRGDIEEMRAGTTSIMPTGLDRQLTAQQLADVIVFLKSGRD